MEEYRREFLTPYLRDVCALELAGWKLERMRRELTRRQAAVKKKTDISFEWKLGIAGLLGVLLFLPAMLLLAGRNRLGPGLGILLFYLNCLSGFFLWFAAESVREARDAGRRESSLRSLAKAWSEEKERQGKALFRLYDLDIIPAPYRCLGAAVYLCEWVDSGQGGGLHAALHAYAPEQANGQIKAEGDRILRRCRMQTEGLHPEKLWIQLNQLDVADGERAVYRSILEGSAAAAAYFSSADYL